MFPKLKIPNRGWEIRDLIKPSSKPSSKSKK
jgi:hypothetical protein